jgi:hypothetical protein
MIMFPPSAPARWLLRWLLLSQLARRGRRLLPLFALAADLCPLRLQEQRETAKRMRHFLARDGTLCMSRELIAVIRTVVLSVLDDVSCCATLRSFVCERGVGELSRRPLFVSNLEIAFR